MAGQGMYGMDLRQRSTWSSPLLAQRRWQAVSFLSARKNWTTVATKVLIRPSQPEKRLEQMEHENPSFSGGRQAAFSVI
jgi:transposase